MNLEMRRRWHTENCFSKSASLPMFSSRKVKHKCCWTVGIRVTSSRLRIWYWCCVLRQCPMSVSFSFSLSVYAGVKKGDRVSIYMPMVVELVVAMLACARIGAVHSIVVSPLSFANYFICLLLALSCVDQPAFYKTCKNKVPILVLQGVISIRLFRSTVCRRVGAVSEI